MRQLEILTCTYKISPIQLIRYESSKYVGGFFLFIESEFLKLCWILLKPHELNFFFFHFFILDQLFLNNADHLENEVETLKSKGTAHEFDDKRGVG